MMIELIKGITIFGVGVIYITILLCGITTIIKTLRKELSNK